jgi:hypothetical protein
MLARQYVEDGEVELAQKQKTISIENHKKRKPVTYASRPPVQKKIATAFTPLNNFEEDVDCQSIQEVCIKFAAIIREILSILYLCLAACKSFERSTGI